MCSMAGDFKEDDRDRTTQTKHPTRALYGGVVHAAWGRAERKPVKLGACMEVTVWVTTNLSIWGSIGPCPQHKAGCPAAGASVTFPP